MPRAVRRQARALLDGASATSPEMAFTARYVLKLAEEIWDKSVSSPVFAGAHGQASTAQPPEADRMK